MKNVLLFCISCIITSSCIAQKRKQTASKITLKGSFESKQGVMIPLSCYCFNNGFLTQADGKKIAICFDDNSNVTDCKNMTVTGFYKTTKNNPEQTSPCPQGEMTYFKVVRFKCN